MKNKITFLLPIMAMSIVPTLLLWIPFFFRIPNVWNIPLPEEGMATIVANYDGPLYLAVAKTFYNQEALKNLVSFPLPTEYYPAHYPFFPLLIRIFSFITNFPYAMLIVTLLSSVLALYYFYLFISQYVKGNNALWATLVFSIFPARWLIVRSVGSAEPLFLASIIASIYFFQKKKYWYAGIWGAVAQLTKSPAILLFISYLFIIFTPKVKELATKSLDDWLKSLQLKKYLPLLLIPLSLLGLFSYYQIRINDFFAYFHSGDNIHLFFPPFQIFNYSAPWVGTFWLEEVIFVYLIGALGVIRLFKKKRYAPAWFTCIFFISILFVSHRDIIRYSLPIVPFLYAAFSDLIIKKDFKIVMAILVIPIFLFSLAYISQNVMPISDWAPFL